METRLDILPTTKQPNKKNQQCKVSMYPTSHQARIWHKAILLWKPHMNQNSCAAGAKNTWPHQHSSNGTPQTPSNQLNPAKHIKPEG